MNKVHINMIDPSDNSKQIKSCYPTFFVLFMLYVKTDRGLFFHSCWNKAEYLEGVKLNTLGLVVQSLRLS